MSKKACYAIPLDEPAARRPAPDRVLDEAFRIHRAGGFRESAELCRKVLELRPTSTLATQILGVSLFKLGDVGGAMSCFERAVELEPLNADCHNNLGNVLSTVGRNQEAAERLMRAIELNPNLADAHSNLCRVLGELGRFDEAVTEAQTACRLNPRLAEAYINFGRLLMDLGLIVPSLALFEKALDTDPCRSDAHSNYLMSLQYSPVHTDAQLLQAARRWANCHTPVSLALPAAERKKDGVLRVGYVSGDMRAHPSGYVLEKLIPDHDRSLFEVFAYSNSPVGDSVTARIRSACDWWRDISGLNDDEAARLVRQDGIDVLIDLSGHTAWNRLGVFARKPAQVQATWLGYFATTGMPQMDYILRDRTQIPESEEPQYVERFGELPVDLFCFAPPHEAVEVGPPPAVRRGWVTFGSFNNLSKFNDEVARLWSAVLHAVPDSKLYMNRSPLRSEIGKQVVVEAFAKHGIGPDRLILTATNGREEYLRSYSEVDVVLDTFPFNGGTTTYEALWMGVPVVTRTWNRMVGHFGESILRGVGLTDWIARDDDSFVAAAVALARDYLALTTIRAGLRDRFLASPLCSGRSFVQGFEKALLKLWETRN